MEKKITAVQDLIHFINDMSIDQTLSNGCTIETVHIPSLLHKCTEMLEIEKQQIIDANVAGMEFIPVDTDKYLTDAIEYFTNTYK